MKGFAKLIARKRKFGGGLILALVNMYRNVKAQPAETVGDQPA